MMSFRRVAAETGLEPVMQPYALTTRVCTSDNSCYGILASTFRHSAMCCLSSCQLTSSIQQVAYHHTTRQGG